MATIEGYLLTFESHAPLQATCGEANRGYCLFRGKNPRSPIELLSIHLSRQFTLKA